MILAVRTNTSDIITNLAVTPQDAPTDEKHFPSHIKNKLG